MPHSQGYTMELHAGANHAEWEALQNKNLELSDNSLYFLLALGVVSVLLTIYALGFVAKMEKEAKRH